MGQKEKKESFIVMAIPQGGSLGDIIASELNIELDIIICKKNGAENNPELAIRAVMAEGRYIISSMRI